MSVQAADRLLECLVLARVPIDAYEVLDRPGGRLLGSFFKIERHRGVVAVDARNGTVDLRSDDEDALRHLGGEGATLSETAVALLAVCAFAPGRETEPLVAGYVFDAGLDGMYDSFVAVDISGALSAYPGEAQAAKPLAVDALWRVGLLPGQFPDPDEALSSRLEAALPGLVALAA